MLLFKVLQKSFCDDMWSIWPPDFPCFSVLSSPKLHNAANANQKEKYEADLKKEIKKLQVTVSQTLFNVFTLTPNLSCRE